jgi:hypothetical protein
VVKEKQRQRQKNSSFIARAIIENNEKFKIMNELYQKHKELVKEKDLAMAKILKIYNLGFKNLSKRKILLGSIRGRSYFASPRGIVRPTSPRQTRYNQTEDLAKSFSVRAPITNIYQEIIDIGNNGELLKKHMNNSQKRVFSKFFKYSKYAKEEPKLILKMKNPVKVIELTAGFATPYSFKTFDSVSLLSTGLKEFDFNFTLNGAVILSVRFSRLYLASGINEKIFIEQTFCYLKTLLKKENANREKEIKRLNTFYAKVKKEFADYIMLKAIEGE